MSRQRTVKNVLITGDEEVRSEEISPFSLREFLRWKDLDLDLDQDGQDHSQDIFNVGTSTFHPDDGDGFFCEPSLAPQEDEEDWGRSFQSGVDSTSSLLTEDDEEEETRFSSKPEVNQKGGGENYEGDDETSMAEPGTSCKRRSGRSSQIQQLKEENLLLKRSVHELQRNSEANERRLMELSEELLHRRQREEKEAQDLETMVQSVEQNLHLMTKRALKAENTVAKLKAELLQLQVEVDSLRSENHSLKMEESQAIITMRQNAQVASEYLNKTAANAHTYVRQLLGEAETLHLVSQLLQSIDKMSNINPES